MPPTLLSFQDIDRTAHALVGGKGANLGELFKLEGVHVPNGFCITTAAFKQVVGAAPQVAALLEQLEAVPPDNLEALRAQASSLREAIKRLPLPEDLQAAVARALVTLGAQDAYAVRSSATAEDLPTASFAGQQDTYLNCVGLPSILEHIRCCWASLFTERAVSYRSQQGFDHRRVHMAVVLQKMVVPQASGILFTADPVSGHRKVSCIEAVVGLGEALVSGRMVADRTLVRDGQVLTQEIAPKPLATRAAEGGGTHEQALEPQAHHQPALTDAQRVQLERLGRRIEAHFGHPQDIEWCLAADAFQVVQSRPITTLYPIPEPREPGHRVFISVGHQQMMTDAMKPLGLSLWQLTAARPMYAAGGRLFVDVSQELASPAGRNVLLNVLGRSDPLIKDALTTLVDRGDFSEPSSEAQKPAAPGQSPAAQNAPGQNIAGQDTAAQKTAGQDTAAPSPTTTNKASQDRAGQWAAQFQTQVEDDSTIVTDLIARSQDQLDALKQTIQPKSGAALLDFILEDVERRKQSAMEPRNFGAIMASHNAAAWLNDHLLDWLGVKNAADTLSQSVPNNVTSELGLALLDVADVLRPYPAVLEYLQHAKDEGFLEGLLPLEGGPQAFEALQSYLEKYGMRCAGEIDVTRPRWREAPTTLVPLLLGNITHFEPGAGKRKFEQGLQEASRQERELLDRLRTLPDGEQKAAETQRMIRRLRNFAGYREYPKYGFVSRLFVYKQAIQREAERLMREGVLQDPSDLHYLTLPELREVIDTRTLDEARVRRRRAEHAHHEKLKPPRVLTSDGEIISGAYRRGDLPAGALVGLAVSAGVIEGRARVILDMAQARLEAGDILVTAFTDPGWTPVFVSIKGLVTEVGGLMTHGAVIAREYGLPAVVGVENATRTIRDGQRIRVHGTDGYVEILS